MGRATLPAAVPGAVAAQVTRMGATDSQSPWSARANGEARYPADCEQAKATTTHAGVTSDPVAGRTPSGGTGTGSTSKPRSSSGTEVVAPTVVDVCPGTVVVVAAAVVVV